MQLRQNGYINSGYIDDFYLQGQLFDDCAVNVCDTVQRFIRQVSSSSRQMFLNTHTRSNCPGICDKKSVDYCYINGDKKKPLLDLCTHGGLLSLQFIASFVGKLIGALPGDELGRLHFRNLQRDKVKGIALNNDDFTALISLSPSAMQEVEWWNVNLLGAT